MGTLKRKKVRPSVERAFRAVPSHSRTVFQAPIISRCIPIAMPITPLAIDSIDAHFSHSAFGMKALSMASIASRAESLGHPPGEPCAG